MVTRTFTIIAYDVVVDRQRDRLSKYLLRYGVRANYSVFECMLTDSQYLQVKTMIPKLIDMKTDRVLLYQLCKSCFINVERLGKTIELPNDPIIDL